MNVAIAIEEWKLAVFEEELNAAGYSYEVVGGIVAGSLTLSVETDDVTVERLGYYVRRANRLARERGRAH